MSDDDDDDDFLFNIDVGLQKLQEAEERNQELTQSVSNGKLISF